MHTELTSFHPQLLLATLLLTVLNVCTLCCGLMLVSCANVGWCNIDGMNSLVILDWYTFALPECWQSQSDCPVPNNNIKCLN